MIQTLTPQLYTPQPVATLTALSQLLLYTYALKVKYLLAFKEHKSVTKF
jgi:hypothetical protein